MRVIPTETCAKCGSGNFHTAYHKPGCTRAVCSCATCSYGSHAKEHGEHLHHHCKTCHYDWVQPVLAETPA